MPEFAGVASCDDDGEPERFPRARRRFGERQSSKGGVCELEDNPCHMLNGRKASHGRRTSPESRKKKV